jgi:hypothetical protein
MFQGNRIQKHFPKASKRIKPMDYIDGFKILKRPIPTYDPHPPQTPTFHRSLAERAIDQKLLFLNAEFLLGWNEVFFDPTLCFSRIVLLGVRCDEGLKGRTGRRTDIQRSCIRIQKSLGQDALCYTCYETGHMKTGAWVPVSVCFLVTHGLT